ncbi:MAG: hypothetical protein ACJ72D_27305 [Marmoricola sp.]
MTRSLREDRPQLLVFAGGLVGSFTGFWWTVTAFAAGDEAGQTFVRAATGVVTAVLVALVVPPVRHVSAGLAAGAVLGVGLAAAIAVGFSVGPT